MILLLGNDPRPGYKRLARGLREAIAAGAYGPGDIAFTAGDLATQLDMSRTTVDQALLRLAQEGLMASTIGRGWSVTPRAPGKVRLMIAIDDLDHDLARAVAELADGAKPSLARAALNDLAQAIDAIRTVATYSWK